MVGSSLANYRLTFKVAWGTGRPCCHCHCQVPGEQHTSLVIAPVAGVHHTGRHQGVVDLRKGFFRQVLLKALLLHRLIRILVGILLAREHHIHIWHAVVCGQSAVVGHHMGQWVLGPRCGQDLLQAQLLWGHHLDFVHLQHGLIDEHMALGLAAITYEVEPQLGCNSTNLILALLGTSWSCNSMSGYRWLLRSKACPLVTIACCWTRPSFSWPSYLPTSSVTKPLRWASQLSLVILM